MAGGYGGARRQDGMDAVQPHFQNTENAPIEETEARYPLRIVRYALVQDSEGAGPLSAAGSGCAATTWRKAT